MTSVTTALAQRVTALEAAFELAPTITPDFGGMGMDDLPAILLALMGLGWNTKTSIDGYLRMHNYPYSEDVTHYVLDQFDDRRLPPLSLWYSDEDDCYHSDLHVRLHEPTLT